MVYLEVPKQSQLTLLSQSVLQVNGNEQCQHFPISHIKQLTLSNRTSVTTDVILALANAGVQIHVIGGKAAQCVSVTTARSPTTALCLRQYAFVTTESLCVKWYRAILEKKYLNQADVLKQLGLQAGLPPQTTHQSVARLMLEEAKFTKHYWQQLAHIAKQWSFTGRKRRPPTDPLNALISLSSTMEDSLYRTAMVSVGLDPNLSFIHQVGYGRQSLIYDLKELNRHQLDLFCFRLLSNNILMADHFVTSDSTGAVRLNEEGKRIYYQQWFRFARIHQQAIKKVVKLAKRVVLMETNNEQ